MSANSSLFTQNMVIAPNKYKLAGLVTLTNEESRRT